MGTYSLSFRFECKKTFDSIAGEPLLIIQFQKKIILFCFFSGTKLINCCVSCVSDDMLHDIRTFNAFEYYFIIFTHRTNLKCPMLSGPWTSILSTAHLDSAPSNRNPHSTTPLIE